MLTGRFYVCSVDGTEGVQIELTKRLSPPLVCDISFSAVHRTLIASLIILRHYRGPSLMN